MSFIEDILGDIRDWLIPSPKSEGLYVNKQGTNHKIPVYYGENRAQTIEVFKRSSDRDGGPWNDYLHYVFVIGEGEIEEIGTAYFNGIAETDDQFDPQWFHIERFTGADDQPVCQTLVDHGVGWDANAKLSGLAYAYVRLRQNDDVNVWRGEPKITFDIKGKKVKNLATDVVEYSRVAPYCLADYLTRPRYGRGASEISILKQSFIDAATITHQNVGSTENQTITVIETIDSVRPNWRDEDWSDGGDRWFALGLPSLTSETTNVAVQSNPLMPCDCKLDTANDIFTNVGILCAGMRAYIPDDIGRFKLIIEDSGTPVFNFNGDNVKGGFEITKKSRGEKANQISVTFKNKALGFEEDTVVYPETDSAVHTAWLAEDNNVDLPKEVNAQTLIHKPSVLKYAEVVANLHRDLDNVKFTSDRTAELVEAGDIISITEPKVGWDGKAFRVMSRTPKKGGLISWEVIEHQDSIYPWADPEYAQDYPKTNLGNPFDLMPPTGVSATVINQEQLRVSWFKSGDHNVYEYIVQVKSADGSSIFRTVTTNEDFVLINGLGSGSYSVDVYGRSTFGVSPSGSDTFSISLPITFPPVKANDPTRIYFVPDDARVIRYKESIQFKYSETFDFATATTAPAGSSLSIPNVDVALVYHVWYGDGTDWYYIQLRPTESAAGVAGPAGDTLYTWVKYAENSDGTVGFADSATALTRYVGLSYNNTSPSESTNPADYEWTDWKGEDGLDSINALPAPISPAMIGGSADIVFTLNTRVGGTASVGEIRIQGSKFNHPDGTLRTFPSDVDVLTAYGEGTAGKFFLIWSDELFDSRFPALAADANNNNFIPVIYDNAQWLAFNNTNQAAPITFLATDCLLAVVEAATANGGLTTIVPYIGTQGADGDNAVIHYIGYPNGLAIKNGTGSISLEVRKIEGGAETTLMGSVDPQFYIDDVAQGRTLTLDGNDIDGSQVVQLKDGVNILDSVTAIDVLDGSDGVVGSVTPDNGLSFVKGPDNGSWVPASTTTNLTFKFYRSGQEIASRVSVVTRNGVGALSATVGATSGEATSVSLVGNNTSSLTVRVTHTDSNVLVGESVVSVVGGSTGAQGIQGPQGNQGTQGPAGSNGQTSYFHVAYANNATGTSGFNQSSGKYIGTYVDFVSTDSSDPADYEWKLFEGLQGPQGTQGIQGSNGSNGQTSYLHIAYANNATGTSGFNQNSGTYIGTYVDFTATDSNDPADYDWKLFVGPQGPQGNQGTQGPAGSTGPVGPQGSTGQGGAGWFRTQAEAVANGRTRVVGDIAADGPTRWNGSSWTPIAEFIDGDLLVDGAITARKIAAGEISAAEINVDNLFAEQITVGSPVGFIRYEDGTSFAQLGGGALIEAGSDTQGSILTVRRDGSVTFDAKDILPNTVPLGAISSEEIDRILSLTGSVGPATGGFYSERFTVTNTPTKIVILPALTHGSNDVNLSFTGQVVVSNFNGPAPAVSARVRIQRSLNGQNSYSTVGAAETIAGIGETEGDISFTTWIANVTRTDTDLDAGDYQYRVYIDQITGFSKAANVTFSAEEAGAGGATGTYNLPTASGNTKGGVKVGADLNINSEVLSVNASESSTASALAKRNASGDINARLFRSEYDTTNSTVNFIMTQVDTASNNYIRPTTPTQFRAAVTDAYYAKFTANTFTGVQTFNSNLNVKGELDYTGAGNFYIDNQVNSSEIIIRGRTSTGEAYVGLQAVYGTSNYVEFRSSNLVCARTIDQGLRVGSSAYTNHMDLKNDGNNSFVNSNTGHLYLYAAEASHNVYLRVKNTDNSTDVPVRAVYGANSGYAQLYYGDTQRFRTISTGVRVTGEIDTDSISFDNKNGVANLIEFDNVPFLKQVSTRGGLQIAPRDDCLILGTGGYGDIAYTKSFVTPDSEEMYLVSDGGVRIHTNLQNAGSEHRFIFQNDGALRLAKGIYLGDSTDTALTKSGNHMRWTSPNGYVEMGADSANYAHFRTDRPAFYFNKKVEAVTSLKVYSKQSQLQEFNLYVGPSGNDYYRLASNGDTKYRTSSWANNNTEQYQFRNTWNGTTGDSWTVHAKGNQTSTNGALTVARDVFAVGQHTKGEVPNASIISPLSDTWMSVTGSYVHLSGKEAIQHSDTYLRLGTGFTDGVYSSKQIYTGNKFRAGTSNEAYLSNTELKFNGAASPTIQMGNEESHDKIRLWNTDNWLIGMRASQTYGWLNHYAMTFSVNTSTGMGWAWRKHTEADTGGSAAMSLSNNGELNVKSRIGFAGGTSRYLSRTDKFARWTSEFGTLDFGCSSATNAYFTTSVQQFYFNKKIYVNSSATDAIETNGGVSVGTTLSFEGTSYQSLSYPTDKLRINNAYGYVDIGVSTDDYCYINSPEDSAPNGFYFNKTAIFRQNSGDNRFKIEAKGSVNDEAQIELNSGDEKMRMFWRGVDDNFGFYMNGSTRLRWTPDNKWTATGTIEGAEVQITSDARRKENITPITGALDKLMFISGCTYDHLDMNGERKAGHIAQEVREVLPEAVNEVDDELLGKKLVLVDSAVGALQTEAIKELKLENDELKARLAKLEKLVEGLI